MISTGLLEDAIRSADTVLTQLRPFIESDDVKAIVVCEPSCLATMKDEYLQLKLTTDIALRRRLAEKSMLVEEFIERNWSGHPIPPTLPADVPNVLFHGHCHQKSLWGEQTAVAALRRILGDKLTVLNSGCCGMAGSFGYTKDRYEVSMKIGEQSLFVPIRESSPDSLILAPGTSCRHQIHDGTSRQAIHPVQLLHRVLCK